MKKIYLLLAVITSLIVNHPDSFAQSGLVYTVAGGGSSMAENVPATSASINIPTAVFVDQSGNIFIGDLTGKIRKVDAISGLITTVAGGGTSSADGIPATDAAVGYTNSVTVGMDGNMYIHEGFSIRKVDATTGIISTIYSGFSGGMAGVFAGQDGNIYAGFYNELLKINPITGAKTTITSGLPNTPAAITMDNDLNIYFAYYTGNYIFKWNAVTGIVTTVAGGGTGYIDGASATSVWIGGIRGLSTDGGGNIFFLEWGDNSIKRIDAVAGTITMIAGGGMDISEGKPALGTYVSGFMAFADPVGGNVYYSDYSTKVRRFSYSPMIGVDTKDNYKVKVNKLCNGPELTAKLSKYTPGMYVATDFGDGSTDSSTIVPGYISGANAVITHTYNVSGIYNINQVLYKGGIPVDTFTTIYNYTFCRTVPVNFYYDANGNCIKDGAERGILVPSVTEVDSNGIHIATLSATTGLDYNAYGKPGDVYSFKQSTVPAGLNITCPLTGIWSHTLSSAPIPADNIGYNCSSTPGFDLEENVAVHCGRHAAQASVILNNKYCTPQNGTYTLRFSPKYAFLSAYPIPVSVSGGVITWDIAAMSSITSKPVNINVTFSGIALIGDTIHSDHTVAPITGDLNIWDNHQDRQDTVESSFDPNQVTVLPAGNILSCTPLHYTVEFENTGNDTAHNIYVMDTLPDGVDVSSMRIVAASAAMNITMLKYSGHNIARFDFPNINLPDSSHHDQCHGMVIYNINAKSGLPDGTLLPNYAGIFFDDNEVVMTNTVTNTIGLQPINGGASVCAGLTDTLTNPTAGGVWAASNANSTVIDGVVTGVTAGLDTISYTVSNSCSSQTKTKIITVGAPYAAPITGAANVCLSSSAALTNASTGGAWSSSNTTVATVSTSGLVSGLTTGTATVSYVVTNSCGTATATRKMTVSALPLVYSVTGGGDVCIGSTGKHIFLSASETGVEYQLYNGASPAGTLVAGTGALLDMGVYTAGGIYTAMADYISTTCGSSMTGSAVINPIAVIVPLVGISSVTSDTLCADDKKILVAGSSGAGTAPLYTWYVNGVAAAGGIAYTYIPANGDVVKVVMKSNALCAIPDTAISTKILTVITTPVPVVAIMQSPAGITKKGDPVTFTAAVTGGTTLAYQWSKNGKLIPGATLAAYTENSLADKDAISCSVTGTDLCGSNTSSASATVGVSTLGVNIQYANTSFAVYPNPANDELTIDADWGAFKSCSITNSIGQEMMQQVITGTKTKLHIKELPAGLYYVTLKGDNGIKMQKFVKL